MPDQWAHLGATGRAACSQCEKLQEHDRAPSYTVDRNRESDYSWPRAF